MGAKFDALKADKDIKHCFRCNRCWEIDMTTTRNQKGRRENSIFSYYENFPSYGKQKKICKDCKVEQMSQISLLINGYDGDDRDELIANNFKVDGTKEGNYENTKTN
jgi:hypothetical protein|tara:strand:- start:1267 stop:1587 length:321 start_codon:yes stop_codon:yes gene_type:complete